jgi:hypothetical protein
VTDSPSQFGTNHADQGVLFGRRAVAPPAKRELVRGKRTPADRMKIYPPDAERKALPRHPGSYFWR